MFEEVLEFQQADIGVATSMLDLKNDHDIINNQVAPISETQCIVSNNLGEIVLFTHDGTSEQFEQTVLYDMTSENNILDTVGCASLGGVLLASSSKLSILYPNGYQRDILGSQPLVNKENAIVRVAPDESCLGLNVNLNGYEAIKLYPNLET